MSCFLITASARYYISKLFSICLFSFIFDRYIFYSLPLWFFFFSFNSIPTLFFFPFHGLFYFVLFCFLFIQLNDCVSFVSKVSTTASEFCFFWWHCSPHNTLALFSPNSQFFLAFLPLAYIYVPF